MNLCLLTWRQEVSVECFFQLLSTSFSETESLTEHGAPRPGEWLPKDGAEIVSQNWHCLSPSPSSSPIFLSFPKTFLYGSFSLILLFSMYFSHHQMVLTLFDSLFFLLKSIFLCSLWKSHVLIQCILVIATAFLWLPLVLSTLSTFKLCVFHFTVINNAVSATHVHGYRTIYWSMDNLPVATSPKVSDYPSLSSHQSSTTHSLDVMPQGLCPHPCWSFDWLNLLQVLCRYLP